jgi:hypothetical protein
VHATREPHMWRGTRVWVVALHGERADYDTKSAALVREIVGEVPPEDVLDARIAVRMGVRLGDLEGANLAGANLARADLAGANLAYANLAGANLARARVYVAPPGWALVDGRLRRAGA